MAFSYLKLHPTRRLFLIYFAAGYTIKECQGMVPGAKGKEEPGIAQQTYDWWRANDPLFVECLERIKDDPDWCHDNIFAPWALAQDDLLQMQKMLGLKVDPDRPWWGYSAKQRELLLNERGKLDKQETTQDRFLTFLERHEERRARRELDQAKNVLPLPSITVIDGLDTKEPRP